jgi:hypothetical protein
VYWVTKGYVVLDDASFPIIGEGISEPNDYFLISRYAEAAINAWDTLTRRKLLLEVTLMVPL